MGYCTRSCHSSRLLALTRAVTTPLSEIFSYLPFKHNVFDTVGLDTELWHFYVSLVCFKHITCGPSKWCFCKFFCLMMITLCVNSPPRYDYNDYLNYLLHWPWYNHRQCAWIVWCAVVWWNPVNAQFKI